MWGDESVPAPEKGEAASSEAVEQTTRPEEDIESLRSSLAAEKARAESYMASWQRAQADFINFKRRTEQEKTEIIKFANATLTINLLTVLDDLERAFASLPARLASFTWVDGIRLIYRKFQAVLEAQGLSPIKAEGEKFDPRLHEAVLYQEGEDGMVLEELQRGYKLYDRVVRPALVVVGKGIEKGAEEASASSS